MLLTIDATNRIAERGALRTMYAARKRVFVDLLKWELPVLDGRFEIDQFDDGHAVYLVLLDAERRHLASARLLPTTRASLLDALFPELCAGEIPRGPNVWEITRFCLSRDLRAPDRLLARNRLVTALALHARSHAIATYTGVAEKGWLEQIQTFGWHCAPLGHPRTIGRQTLGALAITIADDTLARLAAAGVLAAPEAVPGLDRAA